MLDVAPNSQFIEGHVDELDLNRNKKINKQDFFRTRPWYQGERLSYSLGENASQKELAFRICKSASKLVS